MVYFFLCLFFFYRVLLDFYRPLLLQCGRNFPVGHLFPIRDAPTALLPRFTGFYWVFSRIFLSLLASSSRFAGWTFIAQYAPIKQGKAQSTRRDCTLRFALQVWLFVCFFLEFIIIIFFAVFGLLLSLALHLLSFLRYRSKTR